MPRTLRMTALGAVLAVGALAPVAVARPIPAVPSSGANGHHSAALTSLDQAIRQALHGSTARHADYRVDVAGVGHVARGQDLETAPASNEKVFVAVTALQQLGTAYHFTTTVSSTAPIVDGTVHGDLVLTTSGDPTLTGHDLRRFAARLANKGLGHVSGHLIVDASRYANGTRAPGWKPGFVGSQTGPVSAFAVDENTWKHTKAFRNDPRPANAHLWRTILNKKGITIGHSTEIARAPAGTTVLAAHDSESLQALLDVALPESDNFVFEMLLRELGARRSGHGTRKTGLAAVHAEARTLGVSLGTLYDGSGLSYSNRESTRQLRAWLVAAHALPTFDAFYGALPVSCRTGTLEDRMCGRRVAGKVHAKTGTLDHRRALSGYTVTASGRRVTFSFLLSGIDDMTKAGNHLDAAVRAIVISRQ
jgi:serine-type D-Ala-D-Ala carboxypeptidase/endopeptidase (penicillin-binding protein 4)